MAVEPTISLHDVGVQLAQMHGSREPVASGKLLSLLKSGQITAGFQFPGCSVWWIPIPGDYWAAVGHEKFRIIRRSSENPKSGTFKVRIGNFADAVARAVLEGRGGKQLTELSTELKAIISATNRSYDVEILERDWQAYREAHPMQERQRTSGRYQKEGWRDLCVIIGAYLVKHAEKTGEPVKADHASEVIFKLGKAANIAGLPAASTIKGVLSAIRAKSHTISID